MKFKLHSVLSSLKNGMIVIGYEVWNVLGFICMLNHFYASHLEHEPLGLFPGFLLEAVVRIANCFLKRVEKIVEYE